MATSPATAPDAPPSVVAWPSFRRSATSQPSIPADAARNVFMIAWAATPSAARAEPALNPAHPNQRMPAPSTVIGRLCGCIGVHVHDGAAGEVEGAHVGQPATAEHHVR